MCYNGRDKGSRSREGELTPKTRPQFGLQAATRLHEAEIASNRRSRLIPDKANLGFRFPCDGPGRGGTCQSDVWGSISDQGVVTHITGGNFAQSSITINSSEGVMGTVIYEQRYLAKQGYKFVYEAEAVQISLNYYISHAEML
ncbi:hypothetical protein V6N12_048742 [Hibiscus sabdariffa]|uniref:photosystem I n=1 Tax=Hibiscus sabdariffa TaxID=183260 RepID=A0ABR2EJN0_9ROSI